MEFLGCPEELVEPKIVHRHFEDRRRFRAVGNESDLIFEPFVDGAVDARKRNATFGEGHGSFGKAQLGFNIALEQRIVIERLRFLVNLVF